MNSPSHPAALRLNFKAMKVLLLYPEFPDTFWSFKHALKFIHKSAEVPPLGLLTVAAMLPADWDKRLVDVNVRKLREQDLAWADVVFISGMIAQRDSAHTLVARCREAGLITVGFFMVGSPGETRADFELTRRLLKRVEPDLIQVHRQLYPDRLPNWGHGPGEDL